MLMLLLFFLLSLGLALAIVRGVAPLSTIELARKEKKVRLKLTDFSRLYKFHFVLLRILNELPKTRRHLFVAQSISRPFEVM